LPLSSSFSPAFKMTGHLERSRSMEETMTTTTRRSFSLGLGAAAVLAAAPTPVVARSRGERPALPAVATRRVGNVQVTALSDGFFDIPVSVFVGAPAAEIEAAFAARFAHRSDGTHRIGFTVWLVDDGERLVLIDTGYAGEPTTGRLPAVLAAIGVSRDDIDAVLITHMHADHINGLVADGRPAFPNAEVFVHRDDVAYFTDPARAAAAPTLLYSSFASAAHVAQLPRLQRFDGDRAITRVISTVDLRGHTPGHTGYRIADGGESLLIVGDAVFDPAIHPARTDIGIAFEPDPSAAAAMRARLFPRAAEERALLAATHMPFPGFGRIVRDGGRLEWAPADWELSG
jgi:glyoxylase-like metal-dependent hydrolase (beta-lactamase superfamily II)